MSHVWWLLCVPAYPILYEKVLHECKLPVQGGSSFDMDKDMRRIITGQPGIGKSVFGWYIIFRVLTEQPSRTIVYSSFHADKTYILPPTGPVRMVSREQLPLSGLELVSGIGQDILVITDSFVPPALQFPTVVISSRGRLADRHLKDIYNHYSDVWHYMPTPTEAEVLEMRAVAFGSLGIDGVKQRMELWGPNPRHVLVSVSAGAQRQALGRALSVSIDTLVCLARGGVSVTTTAASSSSAAIEDAAHCIVQERAAGQDAEPGSQAADPTNPAYYMHGKVVIASKPFVRYVAERLAAEQKWNAAFLVDASAGIGPLRALRGIKFEEVVLALLEGGISLKVRDLQTGQDLKDPYVFPPSQRIDWKQASDLEAHRGRCKSLLVPHDRNKAGLDALVWREGASHHEPLDSTVSESHGLHAGGLAEALAGLGWTAAGGWPQPAPASRVVRYYWAVPEERFNQGWRSAQVRKDTAAAAASASDSSQRQAAAAAFQNVAQYALCVPRAVALTRVAELCKEQGVRLPSECLSDSCMQQ